MNPTQSGTAGLVYSTYLGGTADDRTTAIAVDDSGNAYVTGQTASATTFPTTPSAFASTSGGDTSAFVVKLGPGGTLAYATYLGGGPAPMPGYPADSGNGIAVDASGNAYVTGQTYSAQFPTTAGAVQRSLAGPNDAFVAKLDPTKSGVNSLVWSTYLGGDSMDTADAIAVDSSGNVSLTGFTGSDTFPTTPGALPNHHSNDNIFVAQLTASGSLSFSTYIGGSAVSTGTGIAADASGNLYVVGATRSLNYSTTAGAAQPTLGGDADAFVTKISLTGSSGGGGGSGGGGSSGGNSGGTGGAGSGTNSSGITATNSSAQFRQSWLNFNASINQMFQKAIQLLWNAVQIQNAIAVNDPLTWELFDLESGSHVFLDMAQVTLSADKVLLDMDSAFLSLEQVFSSLGQNTLALDQVLSSVDQVFPGIDQATQSLEQATQGLDQVTQSLDQVTESQDQVIQDINKVFGLP